MWVTDLFEIQEKAAKFDSYIDQAKMLWSDFTGGCNGGGGITVKQQQQQQQQQQTPQTPGDIKSSGVKQPDKVFVKRSSNKPSAYILPGSRESDGSPGFKRNQSFTQTDSNFVP
jgi:hypothetical protein